MRNVGLKGYDYKKIPMACIIHLEQKKNNGIWCI